MRKAHFLACLCLAASLLAACESHVNDPPAPVSTWAADEADIRAQVQASMEAFNRGNLTGHLAIYDPAITFMTKDGPRPGIAPIEASFREHYFRDGVPKQQLSFDQLTIRSLAPDVALATGKFLLSGGGEKDQSGWFTLVWTRTPAGWRAIHDHSS
jgi:ketosteroid isomerase-like protein